MCMTGWKVLWKKIKEKRYGGIGEVGVARIGREGGSKSRDKVFQGASGESK